MHRCKNIAITGARGTGKSTLAMRMLKKLDLPWTGFRTVCFGITEAGPLYSLVDMETGRAVPISRLTPAGIRGIPESFDGFGVQVLQNALVSGKSVVLLDEIGRFERNSPAFLEALQTVLDSGKTVIAVLKQEPLPHIQKVKERRDTLVIDLDRCSREDTWKCLENWLEEP